MRAIDADKLHKTYAGWLTQMKMPDDEKDFFAITTCIAVLEGQPTIEAVEVIRCKNCGKRPICKQTRALGINGYCSDAERGNDA